MHLRGRPTDRRPARVRLCAWTLTLAIAMACVPVADARQEPTPPTTPTAATAPPAGTGQVQQLIGRVQGWFDPTREGVVPWVGSVMPGGWAAAGVAYRRELALGIRVDAVAALSLRNYKLLDAGVYVPITSDDRWSLSVRTRLMDAPRVQFFGIGNSSVDEPLTRFDFEPKRIDARVVFRPDAESEVGAGVGLLHIGTGPGRGGTPITDVFSPTEVPGLLQSASYRTLALHAQADRRDSLAFTRSGGWYRADWLLFADGDGGAFGHQRVDIDVRQFVPVFDERQAVLGRALFSATRGAGTDLVPHFLMPTLGDGDNLRGFANQRFADRHRLLVQGEYRYLLRERLHVAGFVDLGRVGSRLGDLSPGGLHAGYGVGLRLTSPDGLNVRADVARSAERWAFIVSSVVF